MLRSLLRLMLLLLPLTACAQQAGAERPEVGETYSLAPKAGTWQPEKGKIEVVEYFSYTCGHCAQFQPMVDAWKKTMPKDVVFHYVPNGFDVEFPYSRGFFAAEAMGGLPKTHNDMFDAIHKDGRLPRNNATIDEIGAYFGQRGLDREKAIAAMRSADVTAKMKRAYQFAVDKKLKGTPALVVAGKYVIIGDTYEEYLKNLNAVIAMERAQRRGVPAAPAKKP